MNKDDLALFNVRQRIREAQGEEVLHMRDFKSSDGRMKRLIWLSKEGDRK